jgi:hypothetical protein
MTDALAVLAELATGRAAVLQPRTRARFEVVAGRADEVATSTATRTAPPPATRTAPPPATRTPPPPPPIVARRETASPPSAAVPRPAETAVARRETASPPAAMPRPGETAVARRETASPPPAVAPGPGETAVAGPRPGAGESRAASFDDDAPAEHAAGAAHAARPRGTVGPAVRAAETGFELAVPRRREVSRPEPLGEPPPPPPVHVTIERVEVVAHTPSPPARPPARPAPAGPSLERFLGGLDR